MNEPSSFTQTFDEKARLAELHSLDILDTPADKYFDRYTHLISEIFNVPMAAVSLVDEDRQWNKSSIGMDVHEIPLEESFCVHALDKDMLEVSDTLEDEFFRHHPAVVGSPFIRFYMGVVLHGPTGQPLGCLSIMDTHSRYISGEQRAWLVTFGLLVQELIVDVHAFITAGEARIEAKHRSLRNKLSGLPEQALFLKTLKHLLGFAQKERTYLAILFLRINKIEEISRVHGRPVRDAMLCGLGERLSDPDTRTLTVGHLNQASFAAVVQLPSLNEILDVVTPIANKLSRPIEVEETTIHPDIDIGISLSSLNGFSPEDLLESATAALDGPSFHAGLYFFSREVEEKALRRDTIAQRLEAALEEGQLIKYYQPLVSINDNYIVGFEALARWQDPELGDVSPGDFVPIAEKNARLCRMLTEWSLTTVCKELPKWPFRPENPAFRIAINIPSSQFYEKGFVDRVLQSLEGHNISPERLTLELTEESILADVNKAMKTMREFRSHNIHISLDDFGTGYSSLTYLKDLPLDTLKIDKSFIDDLPHDSRST
ncbi:MAG: EAL domain-containing protein, partial [Haliea sp.]